jgi:hypothetical protein
MAVPAYHVSSLSGIALHAFTEPSRSLPAVIARKNSALLSLYDIDKHAIRIGELVLAVAA